MTTFNYITCITDQRVGIITLNRPEKRNALSFDLIAELKVAFEKYEMDPGVNIIILKANGAAFCAGADITDLQRLQSYSFEQNVADSNHLKELFLIIYTLKKVVVAQVQGHALAGGCGLATVCDFVFTVPEARFGYPEVKIGFIPAIVMIFLLRKIGEAEARRLLLSGDSINAEQAFQMGLVHEIVSSEKLEKHVMDFATRLIHTNSSHAMMITKQMITKLHSMSLQESLSIAADMNARARESDDFKRGINAFLKKEKIEW
ncbi:enoyl-CoA hydratase-related protein [Chryseolinea sp. H1M3-3]|uniref:enoyl-CoA hydratase/isomerase family protein n=1 Tax=Chryseolinea sp. H1M3-3 TaxID=3034144 RepID=UPI0023EC6929|nr:enoyl-CoA hydratase-related protein [Chryseolinea sp. H1M3-3]